MEPLRTTIPPAAISGSAFCTLNTMPFYVEHRIDMRIVDRIERNDLGIVARRASYDVDFAVAVRDWQQFDALRARLPSRGNVKEQGTARQRLYFLGG